MQDQKPLTKFQRRGLLLATLAFVCHLLSVAAHSADMISQQAPVEPEQVQSNCHSSTETSVDTLEQRNISSSCCDGTCSMQGCHSSSAMLSTPNIPLLRASDQAAHFMASASPVKRISSLYRPPNLA